MNSGRQRTRKISSAVSLGTAAGTFREQIESLARAVDSVSADASFQAWLAGVARLWRYGSMNQALIVAQNPAASCVQGRRAWEAAGRKIRPREQPITVFAPSRPGHGNPWPFVAVSAFDISQTLGTPIPVPNHLKGMS